LTTGIELYLHPRFFLPVWSIHPTILYSPLLFRREGAEQAGRVCGGGQRRHPGVGIQRPSENMNLKIMFHEVKHAKHAVPLKTSANTSNISNNDGKRPNNFDNIKDGIEDANQNGRIDGDNGDGYWAKLEIWIETNPNDDDTDGDGFLDNWEKSKKYNPLSIDTDRDGISDDDEDLNGNGYRDGDETSATKEDTDDDGLPDLLEKEGWKVTIIEENTKDITDEYMVYSDPNEPDKDGDGLTDLSEYLNSTDPDDSNTDDDKFTDYEEITSSTPTLPWGIDGKPPVITEIKLTYDEKYSRLGPIRILSGYDLNS